MKEKENNEQMLSIPEINKRFFEILSYYDYTGYKLAKEVEGVSQAKISQLKKGRNKVSVDLICALLQKFPNIDSKWLLLGQGQMLENDKNDDVENDILQKQVNQQIRKLQERKIIVLTEKIEKFIKDLESFKSSIND